ncbi:NERD domain-containing protein [Sutcliffiella cohnii]
MAIFKGREALLKNLQDAVRPEDQKGLDAELEVGDFLAKALPKDTYVIAQPEVGELQPDFLVISPKYGFRLIEVKNLSIRYIDKISSNGVLETKYGDINPLVQVKSYVEALKNYLVSNHVYFKKYDPFRMIGYCVIYKGLSKREFDYKFSRQISSWNPIDRNNFYKHHLFLNDQKNEVVSFIEKATKFPNVNLILNRVNLEEIVKKLKISPQKDIDEFYRIFSEQDEKIAIITSKISKINETIESYNVNSRDDNQEVDISKNKNKETKSNIIIATTLIIITISAFIYIFIVGTSGTASKESNNVITTQEDGDKYYNFNHLSKSIGKIVTVQGEVTRFYYDTESGTKFLTLTDGQNSIEAIIFKDTKVPFINEGDTLIFSGKIQSAMNGDGVEIIVNEVRN